MIPEREMRPGQGALPNTLGLQGSTNLRLPPGLADRLRAIEGRLLALEHHLEVVAQALDVEMPDVAEYHKHVQYVDGIEHVR